MALIDAIPDEHFEQADFAASVDPRDLVYFLLNVGNGDTQLVVLPQGGDGTRHAVVVDVATTGKLPPLLRTLGWDAAPGQGPLLSSVSRLAVVVATHPHQDHIGGLAETLDACRSRIDEVWDPAYFVPLPAYHEVMRFLEDHPEVRRVHPAAGMQRFVGNARLTALSPALAIRNRYDTYGVHPNNASIGLLVEFPAGRAFSDKDFRRVGRVDRPAPGGMQRLLLGADAQTDSWAHVLQDFPNLGEEAPAYEVLSKTQAGDPLRATVFKVPHHASKRGMNFELVERIAPALSLVSSRATTSGHGFPHTVTLGLLREVLDPVATGTSGHRPDWENGIHYTAAQRGTGAGAAPLGSMAVVLSPTGRKRDLWRFGDTPTAAITPARLAGARRYIGPGR